MIDEKFESPEVRPCPKCGTELDETGWCSTCSMRRVLMWGGLVGLGVPCLAFGACLLGSGGSAATMLWISLIGIVMGLVLIIAGAHIGRSSKSRFLVVCPNCGSGLDSTGWCANCSIRRRLWIMITLILMGPGILFGSCFSGEWFLVAPTPEVEFKTHLYTAIFIGLPILGILIFVGGLIWDKARARKRSRENLDSRDL